MRKAVLAVLVIVLCAVLSGDTRISTANNPPPVEVHIRHGDLLYMFDCWPLSLESPPENALIVYINFPTGIAGYSCEYSNDAWILPFLPPPENIVISY